MLHDGGCRLCESKRIVRFHQDQMRIYLRCECCQLVFVPSTFFLSASEEKAEYDLHENRPEDPGYRHFLSRLFDPMCKRLAPGTSGLDFGSGPGPTLSIMFEEVGHPMDIYDPFYANDLTLFEREYGFITATEVVEHLHAPRQELDRLWSCLKPGGLFGLMTKMVIDRQTFSTWHYRADRTHVCFFSRPTFEWLAQLWDAKVTFIGSDVVLFEKSTSRVVDEFSNRDETLVEDAVALKKADLRLAADQA